MSVKIRPNTDLAVKTPSPPSESRADGAFVTIQAGTDTPVKAWITNDEFIEEAIAYEGGDARVPVFDLRHGTDVDSRWSWHVDPDAEWTDNTPELYDGRPGDIEGDKKQWVDNLKMWTPWSTTVLDVQEQPSAASLNPKDLASARADLAAKVTLQTTQREFESIAFDLAKRLPMEVVQAAAHELRPDFAEAMRSHLAKAVIGMRDAVSKTWNDEGEIITPKTLAEVRAELSKTHDPDLVLAAENRLRTFVLDKAKDLLKEMAPSQVMWKLKEQYGSELAQAAAAQLPDLAKLNP